MKRWEIWDSARDYYWAEYQKIPAVIERKEKQENTRGKFGSRAKFVLGLATAKQCFYCEVPAYSYHHNSYEPGDEFTVLALCLDCHSRVDKEQRRDFRSSLDFPTLSEFYHAVLNCYS